MRALPFVSPAGTRGSEHLSLEKRSKCHGRDTEIMLVESLVKLGNRQRLRRSCKSGKSCDPSLLRALIVGDDVFRRLCSSEMVFSHLLMSESSMS